MDDGDVLSGDDLVVRGYCEIPRQEFTDAVDRMVGRQSCGLCAVLPPSGFIEGACRVLNDP